MQKAVPTNRMRNIGRIFRNAIKKLGEMDAARSIPEGASGFVNNASHFFAHFKLKNRVRSILKNDSRKMNMRIFPRILMYILFVLVLVFQILIVIDVGQYHLYLR